MSYSDCFVSMQPDYLEEIFDFYPEDNISFSIEKHQNSYSGLEDIKYVSDLSNNSQASFSFSLENFSEADRDELLDVYLNEDKANGISNSFLFKHPIYAEYFICKFTKEVEDTLYRHGRYSQQNIDLDIIGVDRNLISAIETINVTEISTLGKSIISSSIDTTGKILTISFDSNCYIGENYENSHIELNSYLLGSLVSVSYTSGQSTPSLQFDIQDITLIEIDSVFVSFSGHQDSIEYVSGDDIIDFRNFYVSNNSTVTLPSIVSVDIEETGGTLSIEFDKNVIISYSEDGEIILRVNGVYYPLEYIQGSGGKILFFNITNTVFSSEVCFISLIGSGGGIKNVDGYDIENFNNISVINNSLITPGYIYPRLGRVVLAADGVSVDMLFDSTVFISSGGSGGFFINGSPLSYVSGSGGVELQFQSSECFPEGETLYLSYSQPGNGIEDEDGDDLQSIASISVENNSTQKYPEISSVTIGVDGISLSIVFSDTVTQGSEYLDADFNIDSSVTGSDIGITYLSGDGSNTHMYTVGGIILSGEIVNLDYSGKVDGLTDSKGLDLLAISNFAVINNSEHEVQPISLLSAQIERSYLTLTFDGPVVYAGEGFGDTYFNIVGSIHGVVGLSYSAHPYPEVLVFITNETMTVEEYVLFNFDGHPDILEDENGVDVPAITDFVCEVLVFVEPLYSNLSWPCCDKSKESPAIACTEDEYYDGSVTRIVRTFYNQTLSNNELEGLADCGFRIATSTLTPTSIKIPKILPTGGEMHYFNVSAGFCWSIGLSQDIPYTLFHVRNAEGSPIARQLRLIWNLNDRTFILQDNGATVTPLTSSTLLLSEYMSIRDYFELTVNGSAVTLVYKKRVQTLLDYNEDITYFNTDMCSWQLSSDASLYDPVLYFGGYEYQSFAAYYNLMVGDCTWSNLG